MKKAQKLTTIFLFSIFYFLFSSSVKAAVLYLDPQSQTVYQGDSFIVEVKIDTEGEKINTVEGNLIFSSSLLRVTDFSKGGSILSLWVQEPSVLKEKISFMAGAPGGFRGNGLIGKIIFLAESLGKAKVSFEESSQVLLHEPQPRQTQLTLKEGDYEILEKPEELPVISSKSHPEENNWYPEKTFSLYWKLKEKAEYSWVLSHSSEAEPDDVPDKPKPKEGLVWMGAMRYEDLEDGIYYFHLKEKIPDQDWSEKVTRRAMIDSTPPKTFIAEIGREPAMYEGEYFLSFATVDEISGIDHYKIAEVKRHGLLEELLRKEEKKEWKTVKSPYILEDQTLESQILVKAVDKAGNEKTAIMFPPYKITWKDVIIGIVLLGILIKIIWWIIKKHFAKKHKT